MRIALQFTQILIQINVTRQVFDLFALLNARLYINRSLDILRGFNNQPQCRLGAEGVIQIAQDPKLLAHGVKSIDTRNAITGLQKSQGAAGVLVVVGIAAAVWSASGYVGAFMRASNAIYGIEEGRPFYVSGQAWWWGPLVGAFAALLGGILPAWQTCSLKVSQVFARVA